jgi:hypothetical protein
MAVPFWILDRTQSLKVEKGIARVPLTDGRESKTVILRLTEDARAFLEDTAFADGPDALLASLIEYWAVERRNSTRGWIPEDEVVGRDEIERFHALYLMDLKVKNSSSRPSWL